MTKDRYYEMCKALGSTPIDEEVPVELEDFPVEIQTFISIYGSLRDEWDYMGGNYVGKDLTSLPMLLDMYSVDPCEHLLAYKVISTLDRERRVLVKAAQPKSQ